MYTLALVHSTLCCGCGWAGLACRGWVRARAASRAAQLGVCGAARPPRPPPAATSSRCCRDLPVAARALPPRWPHPSMRRLPPPIRRSPYLQAGVHLHEEEGHLAGQGIAPCSAQVEEEFHGACGRVGGRSACVPLWSPFEPGSPARGIFGQQTKLGRGRWMLAGQHLCTFRHPPMGTLAHRQPASYHVWHLPNTIYIPYTCLSATCMC